MRHRVALLIVSLVLCTSEAFAGWSFRQITRTTGGNMPETESETKVLVDGDDARLETVSGPGSEVFPPGSYMLTRSSAPAGLFLVDPSRRVYSRFDAEGMQQMMAPLAAASQGSGMRMDVTDARVEKVLEEPGEAIMGFATTHYRYHKGYTMTVGMAGMSMATAHEIVEDVWATTAVDLGADRLGEVLGTTDSFGGMSGLEELARLEREKPAGLILKRVVVDRSKPQAKGMMARMMAGGADGETLTTITEIRDLVEEAITDSTFALPAGFTEAPMTFLQPAGPQLPDLEGDD